jgi:hypothetical protein
MENSSNSDTAYTYTFVFPRISVTNDHSIQYFMCKSTLYIVRGDGGRAYFPSAVLSMHDDTFGSANHVRGACAVGTDRPSCEIYTHCTDTGAGWETLES